MQLVLRQKLHSMGGSVVVSYSVSYSNCKTNIFNYGSRFIFMVNKVSHKR